MSASPLILGAVQRAALLGLRARALAEPIDVLAVHAALDDPKMLEAHQKRMDALSVAIPVGFMVTYSIDVGHPVGTCRHLSMSSVRRGRAPTPEAVWMVAEVLGFTGSLADCSLWVEEIESGKHRAINVVQPVSVTESEQIN